MEAPDWSSDAYRGPAPYSPVSPAYSPNGPARNPYPPSSPAWGWPGPDSPGYSLLSPSYSPTSPTHYPASSAYAPNSPLLSPLDIRLINLRAELDQAKHLLEEKEDQLYVKQLQCAQLQRECDTQTGQVESWKMQHQQVRQSHIGLHAIAVRQQQTVMDQNADIRSLQNDNQSLVDTTADMTVQLVLFKCYLDAADKHERSLKEEMGQQDIALHQVQADVRSMHTQLVNVGLENENLQAAACTAHGPSWQDAETEPESDLSDDIDPSEESQSEELSDSDLDWDMPAKKHAQAKSRQQQGPLSSRGTRPVPARLSGNAGERKQKKVASEGVFRNEQVCTPGRKRRRPVSHQDSSADPAAAGEAVTLITACSPNPDTSRDEELARVLQHCGAPAARAKARAQNPAEYQ